MVAVVDLFSGVGGLSAGFAKAGLAVVRGVDVDEDCRFAYEENLGARFLSADVRTVSHSAIAGCFPKGEIRCLVGCAPCQPFSTYSQGRSNARDARWGLLGHFRRLVREIRPELVSMENVPSLAKTAVYRRFLAELVAGGYYVDAQVVSCSDYGVPQQRQRLVLVASRLAAIELPRPTHRGKKVVTVRRVLEGLPEIRAGESSPKDPIHSAPSLSETNLRRIRSSKPGGTWRDWPASLVARCHSKGEFGSRYPSVYGRMLWDAPAPTITTQCFNYGSGRFGHPEQDRAISLREAALLQSFPRDFQFVAPGEDVHFKTVGRHIGNAVPPRLAYVIARQIRKHAQKNG